MACSDQHEPYCQHRLCADAPCADQLVVVLPDGQAVRRLRGAPGDSGCGPGGPPRAPLCAARLLAEAAKVSAGPTIWVAVVRKSLPMKVMTTTAVTVRARNRKLCSIQHINSQMKQQMAETVDPVQLETWAGGEEAREYVSSMFLGAPFEVDYQAIIDSTS